ncbi:hypothetical protein ABIC02_007880 [Bradyrhizobium sp. RT5a]
MRAGSDQNGKLFPRLTQDNATVANGGVSKHLKSITSKLTRSKISMAHRVTAEDLVPADVTSSLSPLGTSSPG